jgi:hypothetical protein
MPAILAFMSLFSVPPTTESQIHPTRRKANEKETSLVDAKKRKISAHAVRLIGLTDRNSSVMQVSEVDEYALQDPLVNTFRTFGQLYNIPTTGEVDVVPESGFAEALSTRVADQDANLLLLPWSETGTLSEKDFTGVSAGPSALADGEYARFILSTIQGASQNTAIFINKTAGSANRGRPHLFRSKSFQSTRSANTLRDFKPTALLGDGTRHIFCPVFGGPDDLLAVGLVLQMMERAGTATIVRFAVPVDDVDYDEADDAVIWKSTLQQSNPDVQNESGAGSGRAEKRTAVFSGTRPEPLERDTALFEYVKGRLSPEALSRVVFDTVAVTDGSDPVKACVDRAAKEVGLLPKNAGDLVVVGRNWRLRGFARRGEAEEMVERCLGHVGTGVVGSGVRGGVLVVKAA